jgi:hypothetical protein
MFGLMLGGMIAFGMLGMILTPLFFPFGIIFFILSAICGIFSIGIFAVNMVIIPIAAITEGIIKFIHWKNNTYDKDSAKRSRISWRLLNRPLLEAERNEAVRLESQRRSDYEAIQQHLRIQRMGY